MQKTMYILPVLLLLYLQPVVAQHCNLVQQTVVRHNAEDERLGSDRKNITTYHYDAYNRLDSMVTETNEVFTWQYSGDTITVQNSTGNTQTINVYLPDERRRTAALITVTFYINDSTGQVSPVADTTVSSYMYAPDGTLVETITLSNRSYKNGRIKYNWVNGNKIAEEYGDLRNHTQQRQLYEYYTDMPYQQLFPNQQAPTDYSRNLVKRSVLEVNNRPVMTIEFTYDFNAQDLVTRMTSLNVQNNQKTYTTFVYDCR
ncbi:MAG TPA: hypothetical protein PLW44_14910 [Chitinophagales bacterium]|nr:hypothetical protein [Chitinophagales bacterium]